jgi:hypothetical protein
VINATKNGAISFITIDLNWLASQAQKEEKLTKAEKDTKTKTPHNKSNVEGFVMPDVAECECCDIGGDCLCCDGTGICTDIDGEEGSCLTCNGRGNSH